MRQFEASFKYYPNLYTEMATYLAGRWLCLFAYPTGNLRLSMVRYTPGTTTEVWLQLDSNLFLSSTYCNRIWIQTGS